MDLDPRRYQSGKKRGLILDEFELYQNWIENELEYEVQQVSLDEYRLYIEGFLYAKYINCSKVSEAFLKEFIASDIAFVFEDRYDDGIDSYMTIDAEELLDEWIREDMWDWKREVKERVGHGEITFNIEDLKERARKQLADF